MKLKIGAKLTLGFAIALILMIAIGIYSIIGLSQIDEINGLILDARVPAISEAKNMQIASMQMAKELREYLIIGNERNITEFNFHKNNEKEYFDNGYALVLSGVAGDYFENLGDIIEDYNDIANEIFILQRAGRGEEAVAKLTNELQSRAQAKLDIANEIISLREGQLQEYKADLTAIQNRVKMTTIALAALAVVFSIVIAIIITRSITGPINQFIEVANDVAEGDLTREVRVNTRDEISQLAEAFNAMMVKLKELIGEINEVSQSVASTSQELSAASEESAAASEEISSTIAEVAKATNDEATAIAESDTLIHEVKQGTEDMSSKITHVSESARLSLNSASDGLQSSKEAVVKIDNIRKTTEEASRTILELNESSKEIETIVDAINAISEQTNLLALNAAIEAARAGEAGRGFAVVAEEVRKLAEESSDSTQKIASLISDIQGQIQMAVNSMNENSKEVVQGVEIINKSSDEFSSIFDEVNGVSDEISEILEIVKEITERTNVVSENFEQMSAISEETAASTEEVAASSEEQTASMEEVASAANNLASMADALINAVAVFRY
ncbi:MAG: methyl-accepting chemotaxis protein [Tissierellaceae bacterium]|nr:methyl-accepting chemotaxis protein [Tissierellaceae bacterium]